MTVADLLPALAEGETELLDRFLSYAHLASCLSAHRRRYSEVVSRLPLAPGESAPEREGSMLDTLFRALHQLSLSRKPPGNLPANAWIAMRASSTYPFPFVRQAALPIIAWVCSATPADAAAHAEVIVHVLHKALLDISPRVRFAAVAAVRPFIDACCRERPLDEQFPQLIPPLCLNRYFPAEGLGRVCADTWQHAVGMRGRAVIAHLMPAVLGCYLAEAKAQLPACREAACRCLGEMVQKLDPAVVTPHAASVIGGLVQLASDPTWQIRDAALVGLIGALQHFRTQADAAALDALLRARLADFIWCVREGAAGALLELHPPAEAAAQEVVRLIRTGLEGFSAQQEETEVEHGGHHKGHEHAHKPGEPHPHTDEPWQLTAGALTLFRLLAQRVPSEAAALVPLVVQVATRRVNFCQRAQLVEALWSELAAATPALASALAPHWPVLLPLFVQDSTASQAMRRAAGKAAAVFRKHISKETLAALPKETGAAFDKLAGDEGM